MAQSSLPFPQELNGGASIGSTFLTQLINLAKAVDDLARYRHLEDGDCLDERLANRREPRHHHALQPLLRRDADQELRRRREATAHGHDFTSRFSAIARAVADLKTTSFIADAELTACKHDGSPDFPTLLHKTGSDLCVWVFDPSGPTRQGLATTSR